MSELSDLGKAAVWYCENGFAIIPIKERGKEPATKHGLNDWFDNPEDARALWERNPNLNIGIVCGAPSHGLLVLDFDIDEEREKDGYAALSAWEKTNGELPETAVSITGSGGMHYLYRTDRNSIHPSANHDLGVDVRCDRSYIVAPPSVHPNGNRYEWQDHPEDVPIATANGTVYDFLDHVQRNGGHDETVKENGKFKLPDKIEKGNRDEILFKYACHLRAIGRSDEEILNSVMGVNYTRCDPPMDADEVKKKVRSACKYERGEHTSDEAPNVGKPGGDSGATTDDDALQFRKGNTIKHNLLAQVMLKNNHACKIDGAPAIWTGQRWEFGKAAIASVAISYADDIKKATRDEVYSYIAARAPSRPSISGFDGRYYIQFSNLTYDVMEGVAVEPSPDMLITAQIPVAFDVDAPYGDADRFLDSLAAGDDVVAKVLAEVVGACMVSKRVLSQSPMLVGKANVAGGEASNGKSTYINVLRTLLGSGNVSSLDIVTLGQRFQAGRVIGKLANLGDDIPNGFLHGDELSVFKKLVTGDEIYTDVKNAEGFEFRPSATFVFSMNSMPRLADTTDGIFRRLAFVPFRNKFQPGMPGFDPDMEMKMCTAPNLERLALLGVMALPDLIRRRTLTVIPDMVDEIEQIRIGNDVVRRWVASEMIEEIDIDGVWTSELYEKFSSWTTSAGETRVNQTTFTNRLLATFDSFELKKTRDRALGRQGNRFVRKQDELFVE